MLHARSHSCDGAIAEFKSWSQSERLPGVSGRHGDRATFLPYGRLEEHLDEDRIYHWLRAAYRQDGDRADLRRIAGDIIAKRCIRVFAILFVIGYGHLITQVLAHPFDLGDERLPFSRTQCPIDFPGEQDVWREFYTIQDQYCVRPLKNLDVSFSTDAILPIKSMTEIGNGNSAQAYRIELHDGYNSIQPRRSTVARRHPQSSNVFVLKKYRNHDAEAREDFHRECAAFATLSDDAADLNIIRYFGYITIGDYSTQRSDHCASYLILEYADCGNLEDFWQASAHPASSPAFRAHWEQIFGLAKALNRIHFVTSDTPEGDGTALKGFHHDIRPWNILVIRDYTNVGSPFPYQFLIGDLGQASFAWTNNRAQSPSTEDPRSSRIYRAPELTREDWQPRWHLGVAQPADVWSLGAVFSEALVWSALGYQWVKRYRKERAKQSNGQGPCFHNGASVLRAVARQHQTCEEGARQDVKLITEVVRFLEDDFLVPAGERKTASQLVHKSDALLTRTKQHLSSEIKSPETSFPPAQSPDLSIRSLSINEQRKTSRPGTWLPLSAESADRRTFRQSVESMATTLQSPDNLDYWRSSISPSISETVRASTEGIFKSEQRRADRPPYLSVAQLRQWKFDRKNGLRMPHISLEYLEYLRELENRDLVFIIDDSESMRNHWPAVRDLVGGLTWIVKNTQRNGIDYMFMSDLRKRNASKSTEIIEQIQLRTAYLAIRLHAARQLDKIFSQYASDYQRKLSSFRGRFSEMIYGTRPEDRVLKPCSYFVFTDAIWQPKCDVSRPIIELMDSLKGAKERQVGISFIQFGNDNRGTHRLGLLTSTLKALSPILHVVDCEPADGNVLKMLLGSINKWFGDWNDAKDRIDEYELDHLQTNLSRFPRADIKALNLPLQDIEVPQDDEALRESSKIEVPQDDEALPEPSKIEDKSSEKSHQLSQTAQSFQQAVSRGNVLEVQRCLEKNVTQVATGDRRWLQDLMEAGCSWREMAELLCEEAADSPWIYFDPQFDGEPRLQAAFHLNDCPHPRQSFQVIDSMATKQSTMFLQSDQRRIIEELCGFGGVVPVRGDVITRNGVVWFDNESDSGESKSSRISYAVEEERQHDWHTEQSQRICRVLTGFIKAAA